MPEKDWLPPLLRDWAEWYVGAIDGNLDYGDSSPIWRAIMSPINGEFGSSIPKGAAPPPGLAKIQLAMNNLLQSEIGEEINVVRAFYCLGAERAIDALQMPKTRMYDMRQRGEIAIKGFLRGTG